MCGSEESGRVMNGDLLTSGISLGREETKVRSEAEGWG